MGMIFKGPAFLIWLVCGLWSLFICFGIVQTALGTIIAVISLFLAPALIGLAPLYSGFFLGDWFPLLLTYGGGIGAAILFGLGSAIDGDRQ
jgi:hypothetical protein